jgi:DNA-binding beta-propeller fold protein YncE
MRAKSRCLFYSGLLLGLAALPQARLKAQTAPGYRVTKKIPIGGDGGWDYTIVDSEARRLYVSHGTHTVVLDVDEGKVVGDIPDTEGVHGIALAPDLGKGFTSNGRANTVTVFNLKTLKVLDTIKVTGANPDCITYDPVSKRVFTFNGHTANATAIDAATGRVLATIPLGSKPEFAQADGKGHIFNNLEDSSELVEIDTDKLSLMNRWPLKPCESPSGMAIDREHGRLFIGCHNQMMAIADTGTGKIVATVPIGEGVDANRFDPGTGLAYSSNGGSGTLTVVKEESPDKFTVLENAPTQIGARTMALDLKTHTVYLPVAQFGPRPAPTADNPRPRPSLVPGTFTLLVATPSHLGT